jgi:glycosyltransferase involved in cell wall biosynthesis
MRNGGAERQLVMLAAEQVRVGLQVDVALLYRGPYTEALEATGAVLHWLGTGSNHDPRLVWQLVRLIRKIRPDIVQSWLRQMDVFAGLAARLTRTAWVLSERSSEALYHLSWKDRTVRPWMGRRADAIIANSRGGDAYWRTRVPSRVRRAVVPNGLALVEIQRAGVSSAAELGLLPSEKMVLHANRLSPEKNVETLIAALPEVSSRVPTVAFLCGDGTHEADARRLVRQHARPDRIRLLGYRADVWSLMKRCDLFVSLSHFEGHPNAVIEAAACGAPLVLSDIPAHREIASDDTAVFVDATSMQDVVRGLLHCLTDPAAAARRAVAARKSVEHLSSARMADEYAAIYRDVLIQRGGQAS